MDRESHIIVIIAPLNIIISIKVIDSQIKIVKNLEINFQGSLLNTKIQKRNAPKKIKKFNYKKTITNLE